MKTIACLIATSLVTTAAFAHGGGLDKNGCHTNKKTGDYHCHGAPLVAAPPRSPTPAAPTRSAPLSSSQPIYEAALVSPNFIKAAQILLRELGYGVPFDGNLEAESRAAIAHFRKGRGLPEGDSVTSGLLVELARAVSAKCP